MNDDVGSYRKVILPSPKIFARLKLSAEADRVEEALRVFRACLDAEIVISPANGRMAAQLSEYIRVIHLQRATINRQAEVIARAPTMHADALIKING